MHQRVIGEYFLKIDAGPFIRPVAKIETAADLIAPYQQGPYQQNPYQQSPYMPQNPYSNPGYGY